MESLSPSQIRDINSLYNKIYEPEGELVETYLSEDEIRLNYAYALSESKNDYSQEQLNAVVEIMTEMTLNIQKGEQAISKILGEEIALSETVGVLEDKENLQEFKKTLLNLTGYGLKGQRGKIMKFLSNRIANKIPLVNPKRAIGSIRRNITNALGINFANQADDATGGNVKGTIANIGHGIASQLNPMNFIRGYMNKKPGEK
mgnify:CR=1 FL=1|tara:strand:+ start:1279 stop:1887 length:609 start_codon:yes stop_codon:yes gene_type:complete